MKEIQKERNAPCVPVKLNDIVPNQPRKQFDEENELPKSSCEPTQNVKVSALKEHPIIKKTFGDLPKEDYEAMKNDIKHGIKVPLHILPNFTVICGYQRLKIARELGFKTVPCQIVNLKDDVQIQEWAIKDNLLRRHLTTEQRHLLLANLSKLYEVGQRKNGKGQFESRDINVISREGDVLERTAKKLGVSPATIARARTYSRAIEEFSDLKEGSICAALAEYRRRKEIKQRKRMAKGAKELKNLILGDAVEKIDEIPDKSIDLLLTDPPYGLTGTDIWGAYQTQKLRGDEWHYDGEDDSIFPLFDKLFEKVVRKLKDNAHIYIFTSWKKWHKFYPIAEKYFEIKNCLVWDKKTSGVGESEGYTYRQNYDLILFAAKGKRRLNCETLPKDILSFCKVNHTRRHPCEKPVDLLKTLISYSTVEGETVLDCFAGSGSTLVAAEELGRNWVGIEINPNWYEVAKARIIELRKSRGGRLR